MLQHIALPEDGWLSHLPTGPRFCFSISPSFISSKQSIHHCCLQFSTGMSVTMILVAALGLLGNTFSIIVLAR